jgi:radical SAM-linked protein
MTTRYLVTFAKDGAARYLSHLDLQATLEYAMRRAGLPVALSEGFNPRPRYSVVTALSLGYRGMQELLELTLREELPCVDLSARLKAALPADIRIMAVELQPAGAPAPATRLHSATYRIDLPEPVPDLAARIDGLLARESVEIEEERNGKMRVRDIRPLILSLEARDDSAIHLMVSLTNTGGVRLEEVLRQMDIDPSGVRTTRESIELLPL